MFGGALLFCIMWVALGVIIGIVFGALPGLTATMGVALFLPLTFNLDIYQSMALLLGIYCGGTYGGSITAILIRTPGTPASAATALDGYPLANSGRATEALEMAIYASFVGGIISCAILSFCAPQLAKIAIEFGAAEYFAVALFGISMITGVAGNSMLKGIFGAVLGLCIGMVGIDQITGTTRFTFGIRYLTGGISTVPALIGLFAISEVFVQLEKYCIKKEDGKESVTQKIKGHHIGVYELKRQAVNIVRSSLIGTIIGIIPATGSAIGSWVSYNLAKSSSKKPEEFGTGTLEGVAASEAGNNGVTGGALIPLLTLGVPGDVVTAVMLGAFMIQGLTPGPMLFQDKPEVTKSIYIMLLIANIFMLIFGRFGIKLFAQVIRVPKNTLMSIVLMLCVVGSYSINKRLFDVFVSLAIGVIAYLFGKIKIPLPPILLGIILSGLVEVNFRRALTISHNDLAIFYTNPIAMVFIVIAIFSFSWPVIKPLLSKVFKKNKLTEQTE